MGSMDGGAYLAEGLQFLLLSRFLRQCAEQLQQPRAGWGGDVQEEGEGLAERAGGQPGVPHPAWRRATYAGEALTKDKPCCLGGSLRTDWRA